MDSTHCDYVDADPAFEKLLSDNRDRYIRQSSATRCGQVAPLPKRGGVVDKPNHPKASAWYLRDGPALAFSVALRRA